MAQFIRRGEGCKYCPFADRKRVYGVMPSAPNSGLLVLSEAPGETEEHDGVPLVGEAGHIFNMVLQEEKIPRNALWITNILLCRPGRAYGKNNNIHTLDADAAIASCSHGLRMELKAAWEAGSRVILAQGGSALKALGIDGPIIKLRGSILTINESYGLPPFKVVPTYHPASMLYENSWRRGGKGGADTLVIYSSDVKKAWDLAQGKIEEHVEDFELEPSFERVVDFLRDCRKKHTMLGVDIETWGGLNPDYADILVVGLADSPTHAIVIPFYSTSKVDKYFSQVHEAIVKDELVLTLNECPTIYQNGLFDVPFMRAKGLDINPSYTHDTIILHSIVDPESPHDLGFIVSIFGRQPYWKDIPSKEAKVNNFSLPVMEFRAYNARDCVALHQVHEPMMELARELNVLDEYFNIGMKLVEPCIIMKERGVQFDYGNMESFKRDMDRLIQLKRDELYRVGRLPPEFDVDSDDEIRWFFFGEEPSKFSRLVELSTLKRKDTKKYKELSDLQVCHDLARCRYLPPSFRPIRADKGKSAKASVGKDGVISFRIALQNRLSAIDGFVNGERFEEEASTINELLSFLELFQDYNELYKLKTAFLRYAPHSDGRIHPSWNIHGTATGRLSCSEPNLQQLPKPHDDDEIERKPIRKYFVAPPGRKLVSADISSAEICILGCETLDDIILDAYYQKKKLHNLNVRDLFNADESHPDFEHMKAFAKIFQFGRIQYGGGDRGVYRNAVMRAPKLKITFSQFKAASQRWFDAHPAYAVWDNELTKLVESERKVYTEFGRVRLFKHNQADIAREAKSTKIQGGVAGLVNRFFIEMWRQVQELRLDAYPVLQIHDQIVYEASDDCAEEVRNLLVAVMESPFMYKGVERHFYVDSGIGQNLLELE